MNILLSIVIYLLTIVATPLVLLFYREFARAILSLLLSCTVVLIPVSMVVGVVTVREHRKVQNLRAS